MVDRSPEGVLIGDESGKVVHANAAARAVLATDPVGRQAASVLEGAAFDVKTADLGEGFQAWYVRDAATEALFAAFVSDALARTVNLERTLGRIVDLAVPRLGESAAVVLWLPDRVRCVRVGPRSERDDRAVALADLRPDERLALAEAVAGNGELVDDRVSLILGRLLGLDGVSPARLAVWPLPAAPPLGVLAVRSAPGQQPMPRAVGSLARRAAVALAAARDFEERAELVRTLREALLPSPLPEVPGLELGAAYRPAQESTEMGGDFYEVRPDGDGWSITVGDVCGKGVEAAVMNGQVRQSLRTVALMSPSPSERLTLLNRALLSIDGRSFVTAIHGVLSLASRSVRVCLAGGGHPPPLVRRSGGAVEAVGARGAIIGMLDDVHFEEVEVVLEAGDTLALYTDGLTDARGERGLLGLEAIVEVLSDCEGMSAQATAERLLQTALEHLGGRPHDDIAILALRPSA